MGRAPERAGTAQPERGAKSKRDACGSCVAPLVGIGGIGGIGGILVPTQLQAAAAMGVAGGCVVRGLGDAPATTPQRRQSAHGLGRRWGVHRIIQRTGRAPRTFAPPVHTDQENAPMNALAPPLQRIIAATDFSAGAGTAADRAAWLARQHQAPLSLMHVMSNGWVDEIRAWLDNGAEWQARLGRQALVNLQAEAERLSRIAGAQVAPVVLQGHPVNTLCDQADALGASLMVAGARGSNPLHHLLIGTTAERLLRKIAVPLLLVRHPPRQNYQRVLLPLDFSPWSARAIELAHRLAPSARLVLLHSYAIPHEEKLRFAGVDDDTLDHYRQHARQDGREHLEALMAQSGLPPQAFQLCLIEGQATQNILTEAKESRCDLIVIGKHGRQAAEDLLLGSVTNHVIAEADCDVLVSTAHSG